jgi:hypothetical protein
MRGVGPTLILRLIQEKEGSELRGSTPLARRSSPPTGGATHDNRASRA